MRSFSHFLFHTLLINTWLAIQYSVKSILLWKAQFDVRVTLFVTRTLIRVTHLRDTFSLQRLWNVECTKFIRRERTIPERVQLSWSVCRGSYYFTSCGHCSSGNLLLSKGSAYFAFLKFFCAVLSRVSQNQSKVITTTNHMKGKYS